MLDKKALKQAEIALTKATESPILSVRLNKAQAAIEAFIAALPDEGGLVVSFMEARQRVIELPGDTLSYQQAVLDMMAAGEKLADALEAVRAKPSVPQVAALAEFFNCCTESAWDGSGIDGSDVQEWGVDLGLLTKTQYDPEKHGLNDYDVAPGEDWYVFSDWLKATIAAEPEEAER